MNFSLSIWYVLPAPVSSWFSIVTCWKIIKVETMPSSVRMMWPAMIILRVPDLLHIIFSLSLSFSCQARTSLFCQCLALCSEKSPGMPWVWARRTVCSAPFGLRSLRVPQLMHYNISCYLMGYSLCFFSWFPRNYYPDLKRGTQELFLKLLRCICLKTGHFIFGWRCSFFSLSPAGLHNFWYL